MAKNLISFLLMTLCQAFAQGQQPVMYYQHLTGTIDPNTSMILDLVRITDSLYGTATFYTEKSQAAQKRSFEPAPIHLKGRIKTDGSLVLFLIAGDNREFFRGRMISEKMITGTVLPDAENKIPLILQENYPDGSIPLVVYHLENKLALRDVKGSPAGILNLTLVVAGESGNAVVSDTIRKQMCLAFDATVGYTKDPDILLIRVRDQFFQNYRSSNEEIFQSYPDAGIMNWYLLKGVRIISNEGNRLCYSVFSYAYTGGAHGMETQDIYAIDIESGKQLLLDDLFKPGYEEALTNLLTKELYMSKNIPADQKLTEAGYFTDEIKPNQNFFLNANGVGFYYGPYDIAPYAFGACELFLTYREIASLLR